MERNNRSLDSMLNGMNFDDFESSAHHNRNLRYVPMSKWGIRYENENGSLSIADFIEAVEIKARIYRVSDYELCENFGELLGGNPLIWYRAFKDRFVTWDSLKSNLSRQFTKADNDYLVERQLQSRLQLPGESFGIYYACMELLFKKLSQRKPERVKLDYLIRNLDEFYLNRIQEKQINTINDLSAFCEGLERSREILRRRRLSQFPLAEPSLQGRMLAPRPRINEVRFDEPASNYPTFPNHFSGSSQYGFFSPSQIPSAQSVKYLGYVIDGDGIRTDPDKVKAIIDYPPPSSVKEVRRLVGLVNWYRRFIQDFSTIIAPITELLKQPKKKFVWTNQANDAFMKLKSALCSAPLLTCPDYDLPFFVQCDASDVGIGAVLWQKHSDGEKVIAYMSQKLTTSERKYSSSERECLAVLVAVEKFRLYIEGVHFTVITDHESLKWLMNLKDPSGRLGRWALKLQGFDHTIVHRKGVHNVVPDALSRAINCVLAVTVDDKYTSWYNELFKLVQEDPSETRDYQIRDGKLYRYQKCNRGLLYNWKLVVSPNEKESIMRQNHDDVAHLGITKTINRICENYFWKEMRQEIADYVRSCDICKASKPVNVNSRAPMGNRKIAEYPFQVISMDFIGVLPKSKTGNTVLFVVSDWYSKFVFLYPMSKAETSKMCTFLEKEIFLKFGVPQTVISDNGSQFVSHAFRKFLDSYGVNHFKNAVYHPQNNPAERVNKVVMSSIRAYLGENASHKDWDKEISKIEYAINTSVHESTKLSPHFIIFGRNHVRYGAEYNRLSETVSDENSDELQDRLETFDKIKEIVKRELAAAYNRQTHYYNTRSKNLISFKTGDVVWKKNFVQSKASEYFASKLAPVYIQCRVVRKTGNTTYDLEDMNGKFLGNYSIQDLRPL